MDHAVRQLDKVNNRNIPLHSTETTTPAFVLPKLESHIRTQANYNDSLHPQAMDR